MSDIHFYVKKDTSKPEDSYLPLDASGRMQKYREGETQNPSDALTDLISTEALTCDIVLCLGDTTTRADPIALKTGWDFLRHIGETMKAKRVYATTGNHDVCSRSEKAEI